MKSVSDRHAALEEGSEEGSGKKRRLSFPNLDSKSVALDNAAVDVTVNDTVHSSATVDGDNAATFLLDNGNSRIKQRDEAVIQNQSQSQSRSQRRKQANFVSTTSKLTLVCLVLICILSYYIYLLP